MDQVEHVILANDKVHTARQRAMDFVYGTNHHTPSA